MVFVTEKSQAFAELLGKEADLIRLLAEMDESKKKVVRAVVGDVAGLTEPTPFPPAPGPRDPTPPRRTVASVAKAAVPVGMILSALLWIAMHLPALPPTPTPPGPAPPPDAVLVRRLDDVVAKLTAIEARLSVLEKPVVPPSPVPPTPAPPVPPAPAPTPIRVVFVYETSSSLTREQLNVLNSTAVRDYLTKKCLTDSDGRPAWRVWDQNVDVAGESDGWKEAWQAAKAKLGPLPKVVVFRGADVESIALPDTEAATLELLKKYGG